MRGVDEDDGMAGRRKSQSTMNTDPGEQSRTSTFAPGFRLSFFDVIVLLAGAWASWHFSREIWWLGAVIGFVVGHFFLFCNVIRLSRGAELVWAFAFVVLGGATIATVYPGWTATFLASLMLTLVLIVRETRKPYYHGIFWQHVNPNLRAWWEAHRRGQEPL
jgi:FtsH-binding integral membrane protein